MGALLLIVGLILLALGTAYYLTLKRLRAAPFHKTGDVAKDASLADARGMIATEGEIKISEPVRAPCCGQSSVAYEVTVDREWEKPAAGDGAGRSLSLTTPRQSRGRAVVRGKTRIVTHRGGALFRLDDGSGPVTVDARDGVERGLVISHDERVPIGMVVPGEVVFGNMRMQTPVGTAQDRTVAFHAVEKILPAQGRLYACGKLAAGAIARPGWTSLVLSPRGYSGMVGVTKAKAFLGLFLGAVSTLASIPMFLRPVDPTTSLVRTESVPVASASAAPALSSDPGVPPATDTASTPPSATATTPPPHGRGGSKRPRR